MPIKNMHNNVMKKENDNKNRYQMSGKHVHIKV